MPKKREHQQTRASTLEKKRKNKNLYKKKKKQKPIKKRKKEKKTKKKKKFISSKNTFPVFSVTTPWKKRTVYKCNNTNRAMIYQINTEAYPILPIEIRENTYSSHELFYFAMVRTI